MHLTNRKKEMEIYREETTLNKTNYLRTYFKDN